MWILFRRTLLLSRRSLAVGTALVSPLVLTGRPARAPIGLHVGVELSAADVSPAWAMHAEGHLIFAPVPAVVLPAETVREFAKPRAAAEVLAAGGTGVELGSPAGARVDTVELPQWPDDAPMLAAMPLSPVSRASIEKLPVPPAHLIAHPALGDPAEADAAVALGTPIARADLFLPVTVLPPPLGVPVAVPAPPTGNLNLPEPGLLLPLATLAVLMRGRPARWRRRGRPARSGR